MASLRPAFLQLRGRCQTSAPPQWQQLRHMLQGLHINPNARHTRPLSTLPPSNDDTLEDREAERRAILSKMIANLNLEEDGEEFEEEHRPARERQQWGPSQPSAAENTFASDGGKGSGIARGTATSAELNGVQSGTSERRRQENGYRPQGRGQQWGPSHLNEQQKMENQLRDENSEEQNDGMGRPKGEYEEKRTPPQIYARPMPTSPSYFSRQPEFNDSYLLLQKLMRKHAHLPTAPSDQLTRVAFRSLKDYRLAVGEDIKASEYARCMTLVKRLHKIHPDLKPPAVQDAISGFLRDINPYNKKVKDIPVDKFGRTLGVGKRKTSTARAWVVEGVGEVLVNGKSLADAFGRVHDRESAVWALKATARTDKYNVWALVEGGGTTGQAEALAMAVGKALMAHEPALKPALRRAGVVTRDPRGVERKKTGHLKARKKPAWVKR